MIRFAYSTNAYTKRPLLEAVRDIGAGGFTGIEILADAPHAFPPHMNPDEVDGLRKAIADAGLSISNLNGNTNAGLDRAGRDPTGFWPGFLEPDETLRRLRIEYVKSVIDLARALGAENVCCASGRLPGGVDEARGMELLAEGLAEVLDHAQKAPTILVGIEYEPGFFVGDAKAMQNLLDEVDHPLLGLNLDIGHAFCAGEDPVALVERFQGKIWNFHLEDIKERIHDHLICGEGDIRFVEFFEALDRTGYDRFVTLELYPYKDNPGEAGRRSLEHLTGLLS